MGSRSILVLDEPEHMTRRKLMLPPFHGDRVQGYAELMSQAAEAEIERWPVGERFALSPRMQAITLEVIVRAVFGISEARRLSQMQGLLRDLLNGMIHQRRSAPDLDGREDILSLLMRARYEDGSSMSDQELRDELMTLLIAGHESTATSLAWAFERLLRHPAKLARLRDEVAAGEDSYADAVVKETLRLRPVLPFVLRKLGEPMEIGGHRLPAGAWVAPCAYLIHRREDVYPEPRRFLPERFIGRAAGTYTWIPFGGGVRRCLGASFAQLEMKEVLKTVVARAELQPVRQSPERVRPRFITLAPAHGAEVVMTARRAGPRSPSPVRRQAGAAVESAPA